MIKREKNSSPKEKPASVVSLDPGSLRQSWRWCTELGATLIMVGVLAFGVIGFATSNVVMLLGWLILVSGLAETVHALYLHRSDAFFFHLVPGVAGIPIGLLILTHPAAGDVGWTLLFACLFTVVGLFRLLPHSDSSFPVGPGRWLTVLSCSCWAPCFGRPRLG